MIGSTFRTVAGLNRDLRTLFMVTLLFRAGTMAFPFLSVYLLTRSAYHPAEVGMIVGAFGVGALLADLSAGIFLGRVSARSVMLAGLVLNAAVLVVVPAFSGAMVLVVATLAWGFAYEIFTPAVYSQTVECSAPHERKLAFSCNRLAINVGMGLGPTVGGLLFAVQPVALFYVNAVCVLCAMVYLLMRKPPGEVADHRIRKPRSRSSIVSSTVRGETQFWTVFGLAIPIHLAYALPPVLASAYIIQGLGLPSYWASMVFFVNTATIVLFEVPLNKAMHAVEHSRALLMGYVLGGAGFMLMGVSRSGVVLVLATLVWTAGEMIVFPSLLSYISQLSDRSNSNRNMSLYSAGVNIGLIATPQISLALTAQWDSSQWDSSAPWLTGGLTVFAAAILLVAARLSPYTWFVEEQEDLVEAVPGGGVSDGTKTG